MARNSHSTKDACTFSFACGLLILIVVFAVLAMVCTTVAVVIHQSTMATTNYKIKVAKMRIAQLETMINQSIHSVRTSAQKHTGNIQNQVDELNVNHQIIDHTSHHNFSVLSAKHTASYHVLNLYLNHTKRIVPVSIESEVTVLDNQLTNRGIDIDVLEGRIEDLDEREDTLDMDVNTPVSAYNSCVVHSKMCIMEKTLSGQYWATCNTNSTAVNIANYYTVNTRCDYTTNYYSDHNVAVLRYDIFAPKISLYCQCSVTVPYTGGSQEEEDPLIFLPLPTNLTGTCTLSLTRCPITQSLPRTRGETFVVETQA